MIGKVGMFAQSPIVLRSLGEFGTHHKDLGMICLVVWNIFSSHPICDDVCTLNFFRVETTNHLGIFRDATHMGTSIWKRLVLKMLHYMRHEEPP